jgi:hypothetical protein
MAHFLRGDDMMAKKENRRNPWEALLFLAYAGIMLYFLFFRTRAVTEGLSYWEQIQQNCNLIPWRTVGNYWDVLTRPDYYIAKWESVSIYRYRAAAAVINILGNIAMFVPFGVFLPAMWPKLRRFWKTSLAGFFSSVSKSRQRSVPRGVLPEEKISYRAIKERMFDLGGRKSVWSGKRSQEWQTKAKGFPTLSLKNAYALA